LNISFTRVRGAAVAATVAAVIAGATLFAGATTASAETVPFEIYAGHSLVAPESLASRGAGQYYLEMQNDGNLVEYGNGRALWSTKTAGNPGAYLSMQTDGNAVVYSAKHKALWNSHTVEKNDTNGSFGVEPDGSVNTLASNGSVLWTNGSPGVNVMTSPSSMGASEGWYLHVGLGTELTLQADGNLVVYVSGKALWSTRTAGNKYDYFVMQNDGNLVIYTASGKAIWESHTAKSGAGNRLTLAANGALALTKGSTVLWQAP
jgi:hypothetical protein